VYINLDIAIKRNIKIKNNLVENKSNDWTIERFEAINTEYVEEYNVSGKVRDSEKACFLSHKNLINHYKNIKEPLWVLEDDARLGLNSSKKINEIIKIFNEFDWDIIYTDVCITEPTTMVELVKIRAQLALKDQTQILNLISINFAGATSYIINPKSISKICNLINQVNIINEPFDLFLRKLIYENKIKAFVLFPFPTTLSDDAEDSQIQLTATGKTDLIWNTFRKMIWIDRNFEEVNSDLFKIENYMCSEESKKFGIIISACLSSEFIIK